MTCAGLLRFAVCAAVVISGTARLFAQAPPADDAAELSEKLDILRKSIRVPDDTKAFPGTRDVSQAVADVQVYSKAVEWILRHNEFFKPNYVEQADKVLASGEARAKELAAGSPSWLLQPGTTIRGYQSRVDGSFQPYALTLPDRIDPKSGRRWPLHVKLHGRAGAMNEVNFIHRHDNKPLPDGQDWIQLDVFGRTNNAYRWAGETDVFEAMRDVIRRLRIDENRVTLHGFSMGGAGAWHLGMHHPHLWSSVGPGAGFVDFYEYQNQTEQRPPHQHATLGIYDSLDYALNAFNVPVCTYGGELDKQLAASTRMVDAAKPLDVEIRLLIGPGMGHKFHPDSFREFMAFHADRSKRGRKRYHGRQSIRFTTRTLKYNQCDWIAIEEIEHVYEPSTVEAKIGNAEVVITTKNIAALRVARDMAATAVIDGDPLPLSDAADGLLPDVYYEKTANGWYELDYDTSKSFVENPDVNKRHESQGPIDDAFMQPFVCVRGTGNAWSQPQAEWAEWTLSRFEHEFDKWMRGRIPVVDDADIDLSPTDDSGPYSTISGKNLILFGDPGSNSVLAKIVDRLPVKWDQDGIEVNGERYDPATHGLSLIYPNPLNRRRYVVINSGHTMHEADFKASNSWLFPRLGDIAVQRFSKRDDGNYDEEIVWATNFNAGWRLP